MDASASGGAGLAADDGSLTTMDARAPAASNEVAGDSSAIVAAPFVMSAAAAAEKAERAARRKARKVKTQAAKGGLVNLTVNPKELATLYAGASASFELTKDGRNSHNIRAEDIHALVLSFFLEAPTPSWVVVRNRALVSNVVCLVLRGATFRDYALRPDTTSAGASASAAAAVEPAEESGGVKGARGTAAALAAGLPCLGAAFGLPTRMPRPAFGNRHNVSPVDHELFFDYGAGGRGGAPQHGVRKGDKPPETTTALWQRVFSMALNANEMRCHEFPLPVAQPPPLPLAVSDAAATAAGGGGGAAAVPVPPLVVDASGLVYTATAVHDLHAAAAAAAAVGAPSAASASLDVTTNAPGAAGAASLSGPFYAPRLLAVDCEMCATINGLQVARVTVVDETDTILYDELVKPELPVVDYLTQYSGITAEMLAGAKKTLRGVQRALVALLDGDGPLPPASGAAAASDGADAAATDAGSAASYTPPAILVGHSLESDLKALRMVHTRVIDTSIIYPHPGGLPYRHSLRHLSSTQMNRAIQSGHGAGGHDSGEDALAALHLTQRAIYGEWGPEARARVLAALKTVPPSARVAAATALSAASSADGSLAAAVTEAKAAAAATCTTSSSDGLTGGTPAKRRRVDSDADANGSDAADAEAAADSQRVCDSPWLFPVALAQPSRQGYAIPGGVTASAARAQMQRNRTTAAEAVAATAVSVSASADCAVEVRVASSLAVAVEATAVATSSVEFQALETSLPAWAGKRMVFGEDDEHAAAAATDGAVGSGGVAAGAAAADATADAPTVASAAPAATFPVLSHVSKAAASRGLAFTMAKLAAGGAGDDAGDASMAAAAGHKRPRPADDAADAPSASPTSGYASAGRSGGSGGGGGRSRQGSSAPVGGRSLVGRPALANKDVCAGVSVIGCRQFTQAHTAGVASCIPLAPAAGASYAPAGAPALTGTLKAVQTEARRYAEGRTAGRWGGVGLIIAEAAVPVTRVRTPAAAAAAATGVVALGASGGSVARVDWRAVDTEIGAAAAALPQGTALIIVTEGLPGGDLASANGGSGSHESDGLDASRLPLLHPMQQAFVNTANPGSFGVAFLVMARAAAPAGAAD